MKTVQENIDRLNPGTERGLGTYLAPLKEMLVGDVGGTLLLLAGAVGMVLLIACANVASLLLARSAGRAREFAVRLALGARRTQIIRQLLTESLLLSLTGGALGLAFADWGLKAILAAVPGSLPRMENIGVNLSVLSVAFAVSVAAGILFGLVPAWKSSNPDLETTLREGSRGSTGIQHRAQSALVIVQMALTLLLLVGAGLLLRTVRHLWQVNPGFDVQHVVTFRVGLSPSVTKTPAKMRAAYQQLMERMRALPGLEAVDVTTLVPLSGEDDSLPFWVGGRTPASIAEAPRALSYSVGPDYLRAMGIPLLRGRSFTLEDTTQSAPVIVIDSGMAHAYFPNSEPIGQTISFINVGNFRVIGVAGHVQHWGLGDRKSSPYQVRFLPDFRSLASRDVPGCGGDGSYPAFPRDNYACDQSDGS